MSSALSHDPGLNVRWREAVDAFKEHAASEWPREAVGLILLDGSYLPCPNVADDPTRAFKVAQELVDAQLIAGTLAAVLHSHPSELTAQGAEIPANDFPSHADMLHQKATAVPWGIALTFRGGAQEPFWFGDQVPPPPLLERVFRHGVTDCYALIRDWHRTVPGITILDLPREMNWWDAKGAENPNFYEDGFEKAGFKRVHRERGQLEPGDCFLCKIRSPVLNHAGVYIGDGAILHHLFGHLSMRQAAHVWLPKLDFLVRHQDLPDGWTP